jgi:hypothetical protein
MLVGDMSDQARVLLLLDMAAVSQATVRGAS